MTGALGGDGTTPPISPLRTRADVKPGFLVEVASYPVGAPQRAVPVGVPHVFATARDAIRAIREQVRVGAGFDVTPGDVAQAAEWAERGWRVPLALLDAGTRVGFTLPLESGEVAEWSARPAPGPGTYAPGACDVIEQGDCDREFDL